MLSWSVFNRFVLEDSSWVFFFEISKSSEVGIEDFNVFGFEEQWWLLTGP